MDINKIYNEDVFDLIKKIPDNYIDLIILDPPYNLFSNIEWDKTKFNMDNLWEELIRIKKVGSPILIFSSGRFKYDIYNSNPKLYKYELVWQKSTTGNPFNAKYMPLKKHEYITVFGNDTLKYNPQLVKGEPYKRQYTLFKKNNMGYGAKGACADNKGTRHPTMVLDFPNNWSKQQQLYPTQKPVTLLQWLIKSYSNENDIVLDLMAGSGATIIAALKENRQFIGNDISKASYDIITDRISHYNEFKKDYFDKN